MNIAHGNSGHPNNADFARMLRRGDAHPDIANWVRKNFSCEECEAHQRPKARRPRAVPTTYRFNHVVGLDLVAMRNIKNEKVFWLNNICWGSSYQQVYRVVNDGCCHLHRKWGRIFGMPEIIVVDPGTDFQGNFAIQCQHYGALILPTDPRCLWQNGRTERAGKE